MVETRLNAIEFPKKAKAEAAANGQPPSPKLRGPRGRTAMRFPAPLLRGRLIQRYKRFLAALQEEPSPAALRQAVGEVRRAVPRVGPLERRLLEAYLVLFDSGNVAQRAKIKGHASRIGRRFRRAAHDCGITPFWRSAAISSSL